tara:strand:- start:9753 stop:9926 length:174 start_codon:yes stop_codon:yes gene_type:complete
MVHSNYSVCPSCGGIQSKKAQRADDQLREMHKDTKYSANLKNPNPFGSLTLEDRNNK